MRSTTPPLYYKRPEGVSVPYYIAGATREGPHSLRVLPVAPCNRGHTMSTADSRISAAEQTTYGLPSSSSSSALASVLPVANPFGISNSSTQGPVTVENSADFVQQSATRWSTSATQSAHAISVLEAEEASLLMEEQAMRAKLAELQLTRQRQSEEQLELSHGWAALLDREERYFTEPFIDLSEEVMAREHQCGLLQDQRQQAEAHLEALRHEYKQYDAVVEEGKNMKEELQRVREGFLAIERRRKACRLRAERLFDAESKRAVEAARHVRVLDAQLKDMASNGPLAETQSVPPSRSTLRGVTFAQKSIILDEGEEECAGLTQGIDGTSVCLQNGDNDEDDDDVGGISGPSAIYSLGVMKRQRVELQTA